MATIYCVLGKQQGNIGGMVGYFRRRVKQKRCKTGSKVKRYVKYSVIGEGVIAAVDLTKIRENHMWQRVVG